MKKRILNLIVVHKNKLIRPWETHTGSNFTATKKQSAIMEDMARKVVDVIKEAEKELNKKESS